MKLAESEALPQVIKMWVLKHPDMGYLSRSGWTNTLQEARKWNRRSDASLTKIALSSKIGVKDSFVTCISFTHGFQAVTTV